MLRLDFSLADLSLPPQREKTRRASISGVQDKVQLSRRREAAVASSRLSPEAKGLYLDKFHDRLKALAQ